MFQFWMGNSSGSNFHQGMPPPNQSNGSIGLQTSPSLFPSNQAGLPNMQEPMLNSDPGHNSATERANYRETWQLELSKSSDLAAPAAAKKIADKGKEVITNCDTDLQFIRGWIPNCSRITLREIAGDRVDVVADKMKVMPEEILEEIKSELTAILEGTDGGSSHHNAELLHLQKLVRFKADLTSIMLFMAHHVQLEILVAIKMRIKAFLHPSVVIPRSCLAEIFLYQRCRNIACQSALPSADCRCGICYDRYGFCNQCMCVICSQYDFEFNTCRWIGCNVCSHWTHTDCAIRNEQIRTVHTFQNGVFHAEMALLCHACNMTSELVGWAKNIFQQYATSWDRDTLLQELEYVVKIFRLSVDSKGRKLFNECADHIGRIRAGTAESTSPEVMLQALQELELGAPESSDTEELGRLNTPGESSTQMSDDAQEVEDAADDTMLRPKKPRLGAEQLTAGRRLRKRQHTEELESVVRLKQAEAEMFQLKADEARQDAERIQAAMAKSEKAAEEEEEEYTTMYLKRRLEEAEAERHLLYERIKQKDNLRPPPPPTRW
ncbi:hypothetical protein ABZP36_009314 [Zizania latifolia]